MKNKSLLIIFFSWFFIIFIIFLGENSYILEDMQLNPFDYARITDVD